MSSAPGIDPHLTVTVKRVDGGRVSNWLHDNVAEGDVLEASKPAGVFCPSDSERPVVAFAGGSGVTPVISIAKSLLASTSRPVRSEERRVGKECVSTCRSRCSPYTSKKKPNTNTKTLDYIK